MAKLSKCLIGIVCSFLLLVLLLVVVVYLPPVQNFLVHKVTEAASASTGMNITIDRVRLSFPLNLKVLGVLVTKPNEKAHSIDTIARISSVTLGVELRPLFHSEIRAEQLLIQDIQFDTSDLIAQVILRGRAEELSLTNNDIHLSSDSIILDQVRLAMAHVDIALVDTIVEEDTTETINPWKVAVNRLQLIDSSVRMEEFLIDLSHLNLTADSVYYCATELRLQDANLFTPHSSLQLIGRMDMNTFADENPGRLSAYLRGEIGREDLLPFLVDLPSDFLSAYPYQPLSLDATLYGNMHHLAVSSLDLSLPTAFSLSAQGEVDNIYDPDRLLAALNINLETQDANFLLAAFLNSDTQKLIQIPLGTSLRGDVSIDSNIYRGDLLLTEGGGRALIDATCEISPSGYLDIAYSADITTTNLLLGHFVPSLDLSSLSLTASLTGAGTDFLDSRTSLTGDVNIRNFLYSDFDLSGTTASISIDHSVASASIHSVNTLIAGDVRVDALLHTNDIRGTLSCQLDTLDLFHLGIAPVPLSTSLCAHIDLETDLRQSHSLQGFIGDFFIRDSTTTYHAYDLELDAFTRPDTTLLRLNSGDLDIDLTASGGYVMLSSVGTDLTRELLRQIDRKYISQDTLKQLLPIGNLRITSGQENFAYYYAKRLGYDFRSVSVDLSSSPTLGINGYARVDSLNAFGFEMDHLRIDLSTEDNIFHYALRAQNDPSNPLYTFKLLTNGDLFATGSNVALKLYDKVDSLGVSLALSASFVHDGILLSITDDESILGYERFTSNHDNYVFLADNGRLSSDLTLTTGNTSISLYSDDTNTSALQDLTLAIDSLDLAPIFAIIPYCPRMKGILTGDFHVTLTSEEFSLASAVGIDDFYYEDIPMGNLYTEFTYTPQGKDTHCVDGFLNYNSSQVATIRGTYTVGETSDLLDADLAMQRLPLNLANGFIPDQIVGLRGYGDGHIKLDGTLSDLQINGTLDLDSAYLVSVPYGIELKIDDKPLAIRDSKIRLEDFRLYSNNDQPLTVNGEVDLTDITNMTTRLTMTATNWLVIDAKENRKSEAFGKAYVDLNATASGPLASLRISGDVNVLGNTDLTYVLRDSPISTDNSLEGLVQFADLSSPEEELVVTRPVTLGPYIDLRLSVAKDARIFVALNAIKTNYIDMIGGGDLRLIYSSDDIRLTGRYTIEEGTMKYSLPVIPLKTFTIAEGSYVEFTGEMLNPTLSITATETTKSNAMVNGTNQTVTFNCGVSITQTLSQMGLEFVISAPENMTIDSELQAMSTDERSKVAVTLLTTGMYLSDNSLSSFSMNSALSSFLQNEINNISSNALRTLDLSVGIDNTTDAAGASHTDYTFKFAKRLWNNRIRIVVGGKVSSNNASMENLFDNISFEYRLDKNAYTNLRLFYDRSNYDYLEGYVGQYGVGLIWRRQLQSLKDLFRKERLYTDTISTARDTLNIGKEDTYETTLE